MEIKRDFIFDPSLVLYLPLYELDGASFMSRDAYGHLCTVTGALWTPQGRSFDGTDDYMDCGRGSSIDLTGALTIEAWLNIPTDSSVNAYLITKREGSTNQYMVLIDADVKPLFLCVGAASESITGNTALTKGRWHHLVCKTDGTTGYILLDGEEDKSGAVNSPTTKAVNLFIGARGDSPAAGYLQTYIGEIRLYNRDLSHLEIQRNYLATKWRYR